MMPCELHGLTTDDVDLEHRQIRNAGRKTKYRKAVSILLPDDICPVIEELIEGREGKLYPIHESTFYERYYEGLEEAGITRHLTPYCCRHTTATRHAIDENIPKQLLVRIMRWTSDQQVPRYVHNNTDEAVEEALTAVNHLKKTVDNGGNRGGS